MRAMPAWSDAPVVVGPRSQLAVPPHPVCPWNLRQGSLLLPVRHGRVCHRQLRRWSRYGLHRALLPTQPTGRQPRLRKLSPRNNACSRLVCQGCRHQLLTCTMPQQRLCVRVYLLLMCRRLRTTRVPALCQREQRQHTLHSQAGVRREPACGQLPMCFMSSWLLLHRGPYALSRVD